MIQIVSGIIAVFFLGLFVRNIMVLLLSMENYKIHKKRLQQLKRQKGKEDLELNELIDKLTKPFVYTFLSELRPNKKEELERKLKIAQWDKVFNPMTYRATGLILKLFGLGTGAFMWSLNKPIAIIWGGLLFFGLGYFLNNTYKNRAERLMMDFPDFIRVTEGYLSANMPFASAVTEASKYVGDEWKPILKKFAIDINVRGVDEALNNMRNEVDLFDVREFVSIVRLTLDRGGDARESFKAQAERIREMQMDIMAIKIGQRQTMSIILQGPLLLSSMIMFALPTVGSMMEFGIF